MNHLNTSEVKWIKWMKQISIFVPHLSTFHELLNLCVSLGLQVPDIAEICTHLAHLSDQNIKNSNLELEKKHIREFSNWKTWKNSSAPRESASPALKSGKQLSTVHPKLLLFNWTWYVFFLFQTCCWLVELLEKGTSRLTWISSFENVVWEVSLVTWEPCKGNVHKHPQHRSPMFAL